MNKINYFTIRQNENGNAHFDGFGIDVGGINRDVEIVFIVIDDAGKIIAKSAKAYTAKDLNIATNGRKDYDANKYHISHFFKNGLPSASLAKTIEWL